MDLLELLYHPTEGRSWSFPLPAHALASKQARILIKTALADWGLTVLEENATLVGSELVTNALKLGQDFKIELHRSGDLIQIEVTDNVFGTPVLTEAELSADSGRGLWIVDQVSESWAVRHNENGSKTVWAKVSK